MRILVVFLVFGASMLAIGALGADVPLSLLDSGCTDGHAWVIVESSAPVSVPYRWVRSDSLEGGVEITSSEVNFPDAGYTWRLTLSGHAGPPLRFEMAGLRAYFAQGCVPVGAPVPSPTSPLEYRSVDAPVSPLSPLFLPWVAR